ncbi:magnesium transporter NIPA-domain-containing protein [Daedaleopsis nitida]|nr:magnesium transporter NIPA-domain-containing protein [Daedaleopsis nitida]
MHIPYLLRFQVLAIEDLPEGIDLPQISRTTAAGIGVAIAGNILISLALNCQKLAHRHLERERETAAQAPQPLQPTRSNGPGQVLDRPDAHYVASSNETVPLLLDAPSAEEEIDRVTLKPRRRWFFLRRTQSSPYHAHAVDRTHLASTHALMPVDVVSVRSSGTVTHSKGEPKEQEQGANESDYLKSKLWWLGFLLMNLGEMGNFISYAFAPASLVAPLGTVRLPARSLLLRIIKATRLRDFVGILIAILGAVTVVLSANPSDTRLNPDGLINAMTQRPFEIYALVYVIGIAILSGLSEGPAGKRWVYVDVGLCALFGGFTVLSTKAISTLLTMEWFEIFKEWITYPVIVVLLGTGVGQVRYLNRALMRFDSKIVVPTQFVMFNLSAIVGSALLYGDFKKATFHQLVTFLYGCGATFAGVFIIAWAPATPRPTDEDDEEDEDTDTIHTETLPPSRSDGPSSGTVTLSEDSTAPTSVRTAKVGSVSRRNRTTWVIPDGSDANGLPVLRSRHSIVSLYGFSPAQVSISISDGLLPREEFIRPNLQEREAGVSPESISRRRAVNWLDGDMSRQASPRAARRYGATSNTTSRDQSRTGDGVPARSRSRSASPDPFV